MRAGKLTSHEADILRHLLAKHNITQYEIVGAVGEGNALPGSESPGDLESISGIVVTPTTAYTFWLDWVQGDYSLGEQDNTWKELNPDELNDPEIIEAQKHLH
jgi:hypothetical protein